MCVPLKIFADGHTKILSSCHFAQKLAVVRGREREREGAKTEEKDSQAFCRTAESGQVELYNGEPVRIYARTEMTTFERRRRSRLTAQPAVDAVELYTCTRMIKGHTFKQC